MDDPSFTPATPPTPAETTTGPGLTADYDVGDGYLDVVVGVVIVAVILVLVGLAAVTIRYMFRHKGSYRTNEAKGTELAETADAALRGDPTLRESVDDGKKEYFI